MLYRYCLLMLIISCPFQITAQDSHYWTQQFGTRSALMGGAVVAGAPDNSTVYYNPGALGFIDETSISVNANLYRIENIRIENALGQQADFKSSSFGSLPILVGGMFKVNSEHWKVGYGLMAPVDFNFKGNARLDGDFAIVEDTESPGEEVLVGESEKNSKLSEISLALGMGRKLNERWAFGFSNLFTFRSQTYNRQLLAHMIVNDAQNTPVNTTVLQYLNYYHLRYAAKLGVAFRQSRWAAGLTLTSPSLGILGQGTIAADITAQNMKLEGEERVNGFASDRQDKLRTKFKAPFSFSGGVQYTFASSLLAASFQYYASVDVYDIIRAEPATFVRYGSFGSSLGSEDLLVVLGGAKPVFNVAVGYEHELNEQLTLNLSFRNDMSYLDQSLSQERGYKTNISSWNIYHLVGGTTIKRERSSMSLGLLLSIGANKQHEENSNLGNPSENRLIQGATTITQANYSSIGFLLGYTFNFKKF